MKAGMQTRLDHRAPLVVDTRELGRRPGSMRTLSRTVPAPPDLGIEVISVPEGSEVRLDLRLEAVMEGVLVSGTARGRTTGECVRCLDPIGQELDVEFQELFVYPDSEETRSGEDEDELYRLEGDLLDLEPALRDAVVLALPLQPLCQGDCPGLCPECGHRLKDDPDHSHEVTDTRWSALQGLLEDGKRA